MAGTAEAKKYGSSETTWTRVQKSADYEIANNQISHIEIVAVMAKATLLNSNSQEAL